MTTHKHRTRISHEQFFHLCNWLIANADELHDTRYSERAALASQALEFDVTETKVKEASILTGNETQHGRVNTLWFCVLALAASGGFTMPNLARKGREMWRESQKDKDKDETPDLFPETTDPQPVTKPESGTFEADEYVAPDEPDEDLDPIVDPGDEPTTEEEEDETPIM